MKATPNPRLQFFQAANDYKSSNLPLHAEKGQSQA